MKSLAVAKAVRENIIRSDPMLIHIERPFDSLFLSVSSQFIVVSIFFSTADNCFGLLILISTVCGTKKSLKKLKNRRCLLNKLQARYVNL